MFAMIYLEMGTHFYIFEQKKKKKKNPKFYIQNIWKK